ncbi:hypothetical protein LguiB_007108 [Lonicera macranthoides]
MMIHSSSPGAVEFNFDGASCTSLNVTAPSTPRGFGNYFFSAPTSPTHFNWEQQPHHTPLLNPPSSKDFNTTNDNHNPDFEFDCNAARLYKAPPLCADELCADELFDGGKIKPIKLIPERRITHSPATPRSPKRMIFKEGLSQKKDISGATDILLEEEKDGESLNSSSASSSPSSWRKRWNLKKLLSFRSKSEGDSKDPLKKSEIEEDLKNSSFRSTGVVNSVHITKTRKEKGKRVVVYGSAHELHYRVNRAVSEEMRRKTFLPYKRTVLMGC